MRIVRVVARVFIANIAFLLLLTANAAIPLSINHQGVVKVSGNPFNGTGQFRFAIVDPDSGNNLWTNDGSQLGSSAMPTAAIGAPVSNGIYSVILGDLNLANMVAIPNTVFDDENGVLRIWFDDGTNGVLQLSPDHPLASAPYAFHARTVDGVFYDESLSSIVLGGEGSAATGYRSTAMGSSTKAQGAVSTAMGQSTTARGVASVATGRFTYATGLNTTAMGYNAVASATVSMAFGSNTTADGESALAMGSGTQASGMFSTAMGKDTTAAGERSTAMGSGTIATSYGSTAMGVDTQAIAGNATAMGFGTVADGLFSTAMGRSTRASGLNSTAMGNLTEAEGFNSTAMGFFTNAIGDNSTTMGRRTLASGANTTAMGFFTVASATASIAMGSGTLASGAVSTAIGDNSKAIGKSSTAMGKGTTASGENSTAIGWSTTASGPNSTAMGAFNTASANQATAMGFSNTASGFASTAMGYGTTASGLASTAMGRGIEAAGSHSFAVSLASQIGTVLSQNNTMAIVGGDVGIGSLAPTTRLRVEDNVDDFVLTVVNEGNNANRSGIEIQAGADLGLGVTDYISALDGDGDKVGAIRNNIGVFQLVDLSDRKSKTDIRDTSVDALAIIEGLRVVDFKRKSNPDGPTIHGFIAQEAQEVFPEMVTQLDEEMLGISKDALIPILTKAIQDQQMTIAGLKDEVHRLRGLVEGD